MSVFICQTTRCHIQKTVNFNSTHFLYNKLYKLHPRKCGTTHIYKCMHARAHTNASLITLISWPQLLHFLLQIFYFIYYNRSPQMFRKSKCHHKVLGPRMTTRSKFDPEEALLLDAAVQNLVAMAKRCPEFLRTSVTVL